MYRIALGAIATGVLLLVGAPAGASITFQSGTFSCNGNSVNGGISDGGPLAGWGTYDVFATDGATLTMDATSTIDPAGFHDVGWTMTYTDTEGYSTAAGLTVAFTADAAVQYTFSGAIETNSNTPAYTYSDVWLWNVTTASAVFYDNSQWNDTPIINHVRAPDQGAFAGTLIAGHQYEFLMYLQTGVDTPDTTATFSVTFDLELKGPCPWDCADLNGIVGTADLLALLAQWGGSGTCDFDGGGVGTSDLLKLLANWGLCP